MRAVLYANDPSALKFIEHMDADDGATVDSFCGGVLHWVIIADEQELAITCLSLRNKSADVARVSSASQTRSS